MPGERTQHAGGVSPRETKKKKRTKLPMEDPPQRSTDKVKNEGFKKYPAMGA